MSREDVSPNSGGAVAGKLNKCSICYHIKRLSFRPFIHFHAIYHFLHLSVRWYVRWENCWIPPRFNCGKTGNGESCCSNSPSTTNILKQISEYKKPNRLSFNTSATGQRKRQQQKHNWKLKRNKKLCNNNRFSISEMRYKKKYCSTSAWSRFVKRFFYNIEPHHRIKYDFCCDVYKSFSYMCSLYHDIYFLRKFPFPNPLNTHKFFAKHEMDAKLE